MYMAFEARSLMLLAKPIHPLHGLTPVLSKGETMTVSAGTWECAECRTPGNPQNIEECSECGRPRPPHVGDTAFTTPRRSRGWRSTRKFVVIAVIILSALSASAIGYWVYDNYFATHPVTLVVQDKTWANEIAIEQLNGHAASMWYVPQSDTGHIGVRVVGQHLAIRGYRRVFDHYERRSRRASRQVYAGTTTSYYSCGTAKKPRTCSSTRNKYTTQYYTVYYSVPIYRSVPVFAMQYEVAWQSWDFNRLAIASGHTNQMDWPSLNLTGPNQRAGARATTFSVVLSDPAGRQIHQVVQSRQAWVLLASGQLLTGMETNSGSVSDIQWPTDW